MDSDKTTKLSSSKLVVQWRLDESGLNQFQWTIIGKMPILDLIGAIVRAQVRLSSGVPMPTCDHPTPSFVIEQSREEDEASRGEVRYFVHPRVPVTALVGLLDGIRNLLVGSQKAAHQTADRVERVLMPDGRPFRNVM